MSEHPPTVLVVEDEHDLADLYAAWLDAEYEVRTTYGGQEALDAVETLGASLDVVLLDRRMPEVSGDEVLAAIREQRIDARVAMVTAVEPDFDIVEMGFDDYLVKPVTQDALTGIVAELLERSEYDQGMQQLFSLSSKKALLESEKSVAALEDNEEYQQLTAELDALREEMDRTVQSLGDRDPETLFREIGQGVEMPDDADLDRNL